MRTTYRCNRGTRPDGQQGWVMLATLILSALAASLATAWARHAVLAKGALEMAHGASRSEEASRSGLERCREQMRNGTAPGCGSQGEEEVVETSAGEELTVERRVESHNRREIEVHSRQPGGSFEQEAAVVARASVVPTGGGSPEHVTTLDCATGDGVLMAGHLTIIDGPASYQGVELAGLYLLEPGATLTLEDVVLRGTILSRAGLCASNPPAAGANRPRVQVYGGLRLLAGTDLPEVALAAPDTVFECDTSSRVEVRGMCMVNEMNVRGRGSVRGMVVAEKSETFSSQARRPGHGRGAQEFPSYVKAGKERMTAVSFPARRFSQAEMDQMEGCNAGN